MARRRAGFRHKSGLWARAVRVQAADGTKRRLWFYGSTPGEVDEKVDAAKGAIRNGLQPPDARLTVGKHLYDWLGSVHDTVRPSTFVSYEGHVRMHLATIHPIPLTRLTPNDVRTLKRHLLAEGLAPATVVRVLTTLRMALKQAVGDGLIARNVATLVEPPATEKATLHIWQPREVRQFLDATRDDPLGPLWALLVGTGLRLGEGLGLRWDDLNLATGSLSVTGALRPIDARFGLRDGLRLVRVAPKTEAGWRTIAMPSFVSTALLAMEDAAPAAIGGYVFTTPRGTPLDPRNVSRRFDESIARAEVRRIRIHDLRHTCASILLAQGFSLEDVKRILGHSTIAETSDTYGHLVEGRSRELADGMDRMIG